MHVKGQAAFLSVASSLLYDEELSVGSIVCFYTNGHIIDERVTLSLE